MTVAKVSSRETGSPAPLVAAGLDAAATSCTPKFEADADALGLA
jgi:hypothetical protein